MSSSRAAKLLLLGVTPPKPPADTNILRARDVLSWCSPMTSRVQTTSMMSPFDKCRYWLKNIPKSWPEDPGDKITDGIESEAIKDLNANETNEVKKTYDSKDPSVAENTKETSKLCNDGIDVATNQNKAVHNMCANDASVQRIESSSKLKAVRQLNFGPEISTAEESNNLINDHDSLPPNLIESQHIKDSTNIRSDSVDEIRDNTAADSDDDDTPLNAVKLKLIKVPCQSKLQPKEREKGVTLPEVLCGSHQNDQIEKSKINEGQSKPVELVKASLGSKKDTTSKATIKRAKRKTGKENTLVSSKNAKPKQKGIKIIEASLSYNAGTSEKISNSKTVMSEKKKAKSAATATGTKKKVIESHTAISKVSEDKAVRRAAVAEKKKKGSNIKKLIDKSSTDVSEKQENKKLQTVATKTIESDFESGDDTALSQFAATSSSAKDPAKVQKQTTKSKSVSSATGMDKEVIDSGAANSRGSPENKEDGTENKSKSEVIRSTLKSNGGGSVKPKEKVQAKIVNSKSGKSKNAAAKTSKSQNPTASSQHKSASSATGMDKEVIDSGAANSRGSLDNTEDGTENKSKSEVIRSTLKSNGGGSVKPKEKVQAKIVNSKSGKSKNAATEAPKSQNPTTSSQHNSASSATGMDKQVIDSGAANSRGSLENKEDGTENKSKSEVIRSTLKSNGGGSEQEKEIVQGKIVNSKSGKSKNAATEAPKSQNPTTSSQHKSASSATGMDKEVIDSGAANSRGSPENKEEVEQNNNIMSMEPGVAGCSGVGQCHTEFPLGDDENREVSCKAVTRQISRSKEISIRSAERQTGAKPSPHTSNISMNSRVCNYNKTSCRIPMEAIDLSSNRNDVSIVDMQNESIDSETVPLETNSLDLSVSQASIMSQRYHFRKRTPVVPIVQSDTEVSDNSIEDSMVDSESDVEWKVTDPKINCGTTNVFSVHNNDREGDSDASDEEDVIVTLPHRDHPAWKRKLEAPSKSKKTASKRRIDNPEEDDEALSWRDVDLVELPRTPREIPPLCDELQDPTKYFELFWDDVILKEMTDYTNIASITKRGGDKSLNVTVDEMRKFLGLVLYMGVVKLPAFRDYWARDTYVPQVAKVMTFNRFMAIRSNLHFYDKSKEELLNKTDRFCKVRKLFDHMKSKCNGLEQEDDMCVDESMLPYKGTFAGNLRQYIKSKPHRFGIKLYNLAGKSGILYDFIPYAGGSTFDGIDFSEEETTMGKGAQTVLYLARQIDFPESTALYFDNYFSSIKLAEHLKNKYKILSTGTLKKNRTERCPLMGEKELLKSGRGTYDFRTKNGVEVMKWADNKVVHVVSTLAGIEPRGCVSRYDKTTKGKLNVTIPRAILLYNKCMGGVDLHDMLIELYRSPTRARRWYMTIISYMIDLAVTNSWLLFRRDASTLGEECKLDLKHFRIHVSKCLLGSLLPNFTYGPEIKNTVLTPRGYRPPPVSRYDGLHHWPSYALIKSRCKLCKRTTIIICAKCNVALCFVPTRQCYSQFHIQNDNDSLELQDHASLDLSELI